MKIAVLGAGHLGRIHLDIIKRMSEYDLVGFYDPDPHLSSKISEELSVRSFESMSSLIDATEIVDIVTPTLSHFECAKQALLNHKHVFIEKPVTNTVAEADELLVLAERSDVKVQVGHVERFNPAFIAAKPYINNPLFIETHRLSPFNPRGTDVSVVLDLMIHDIDILLSLVKSEVKSIHASGVSIITNSVDIANARIRFNNGTVASITSSRVAKDKVRKIKLFQENLYSTIDLLLEQTEIYTITKEPNLIPDVLKTEPFTQNNESKLIAYQKPNLEKYDMLGLEIKNFIASVRGKEEPIVNGIEARNALDVVIKINNMILEDLK